jgi:hypothetical protein
VDPPGPPGKGGLGTFSPRLDIAVPFAAIGAKLPVDAVVGFV